MVNKESLMEKSLYFLIALAINLILFNYLSLYLIVKDLGNKLSQAINVLLEEETKIEKVLFGRPLHKPERKSSLKGKGATGQDTAVKSHVPVEAKKGDVPLSSIKDNIQREESILSEVEKRIASRKTEPVQGGAKAGESIGEISAEVSQGGVGFSKGGIRQIVYIPAFPKIAAGELPSTLQVKVWIEPSGKVSKVGIIKRSGVPEVDQAIVGFVRGIKFEPIKDNIIQTGVMTFRFKGG